MILKWVAIRIIAIIFHTFHMCFIIKPVIVKCAYDVAPEKLGKSGYIRFLFSMINPTVTAQAKIKENVKSNLLS